MLETLRHEAFYACGTYIDEQEGIYAGWCARRDSFADGMPLVNERKDVALLFAGEVFAEPDSAAQLRRRGHELGARPASYLVHKYEDEGERFFAGLNGRFHGLLVDRANGAVLFNDRYGLQRLYYHQSRTAFYFAAEAKSILAVRPELRRASAQSLGELVAVGCVLDNRTLFDGISVMPGAARWSFRSGQLTRQESYFSPSEWEAQPVLDGESYYPSLRQTFARSLEKYFGGPQRAGISLTGGLDTRMILAWHKPVPKSLPCYTFGGLYRDSRDVVVAREVAQACGQDHSVIDVGRGFLQDFARCAERTVYLTDGCADLSRTADLYVNERARGIAPVRMTGNYGGEVLRRIRAFKPVTPPAGLYSSDLLAEVRRASDTYAEIIRVHPLSFAVFRQAPWHHYGLLALEETQLAVRTPYLDNDLIRTIFQAPVEATTSDDCCLRLIEDGDPRLAVMLTDRGSARRRDMVAGAVSALHQFSFKAEYAYDYGMPQWLAQIDHRFSFLGLERLFLGRHKFYHYRVWYRDALSRYVREMLLDDRSLARPYVQRSKMEAMIDGHLSGRENHTLAIHRLLTLELIHRLLIDVAAPTAAPAPPLAEEVAHAT